MKIPCKEIGLVIENTLRHQVEELKAHGKPPKLVDVLVGNAPEQVSYVNIKGKVAQRLGINFELIHHKEQLPFTEFVKIIQKKAAEPEVTAIIIQQPLPKEYIPAELFKVIPVEKEIEGHTAGSKFIFPLSLSVLTGIKYVYNGQKIDETSIVNLPQDIPFFQHILKNKKIVIAGRGPTGGGPISKAIQLVGGEFITIHSKTENPDGIYRDADIIITATGKKIIHAGNIKPGVVLLNVGLREEDGKLKGDYDVSEVEPLAGFYTPTPGGLGPIDVLYLYKNVIDATRIGTRV